MRTAVKLAIAAVFCFALMGSRLECEPTSVEIPQIVIDEQIPVIVNPGDILIHNHHEGHGHHDHD